ncbi:hypothetical protein FGB62_238g00 [Gracilaria domingensis]|nr:hypothetical protein FGB62_238g00 [Gracilaria domingensis]
MRIRFAMSLESKETAAYIKKQVEATKATGLGGGHESRVHLRGDQAKIKTLLTDRLGQGHGYALLLAHTSGHNLGGGLRQVLVELLSSTQVEMAETVPANLPTLNEGVFANLHSGCDTLESPRRSVVHATRFLLSARGCDEDEVRSVSEGLEDIWKTGEELMTMTGYGLAVQAAAEEEGARDGWKERNIDCARRGRRLARFKHMKTDRIELRQALVLVSETARADKDDAPAAKMSGATRRCSSSVSSGQGSGEKNVAEEDERVLRDMKRHLRRWIERKGKRGAFTDIYPD